MIFREITKRFSLPVIAAFFILVTSSLASGQVIVEFANTFSGSPATINATTVDPNLNSPVTLSRGAGLIAASSGARFSSSGFASGTTLTLSNNDYYTFTITANSGYVINLNGKTFSVTLGASGTGPQSYALFTSVGGFTSTSQQVGSTLTNTINTITLPATGYDGLTSIEFRIYGYNASAAAGTGGPSNIQVNGTVTPTGGGNVAPVISDIPDNQTTAPNVAKAINFTINDTNATCSGVTGVSNNQAVVANSGIVITGGATTNCTVTVTPVTGATSGTAQITLTATDTGTPPLTDTETFNLTIIVPSPVIINEIYGGGGNSGAAFTNDFIELRNNSTAAVDISGYSIQYAPAAGSFGGATPIIFTFPAGATIQPNGYYLVGLGTGGAVGTPLNTITTTPNATNTTINLSATTGKVALVNNSTALSNVSCPTDASIVDFVGYGTANCFENGSPTPTAVGSPASAPGNSTSIRRTNFVDTNVNSADFSISDPPTPQNANAPTAASVEVGGRVLEGNGRGVFRARVTMSDPQGNVRTAYTNSFGYYHFSDVPAGENYIFTATHLRYQFGQPTQVQFIGEDNDEINFTATSRSVFDTPNAPGSNDIQAIEPKRGF